MNISNFKRIILILILSVVSLSASAQVLRFRSQAYSQREFYYGRWSEWSKWELSNISITINLNTDVVTIYSPRTQTYRVTRYAGTYMENGASIAEYKMVDQDGDRGTLLLVIKPNGQSEIYIKFANIQWAYVVIRI